MIARPEFPPAPRVERALDRRLHARFAAAMLRLLGWRVVLAQPVPSRCVIVIYPHTSNWDFVVGLLAKWMLGLELNFIGKHTLFAGPLGPLFARWGGIPVDRRASTGVIAQLASRFADGAVCRLVIAPEGTRSRTACWKSGFYHLTRAVDVPLGLAFIDYARREIGVGAYVALTGDVAADMARIAAFYADKRGRRPGNAGPVRLADATGP
ncbi:MAG: 1-acyl-sn-glycerol-3-phosphate acyltransferase [Burkholderiales bacterium]|nr:1-acyl-sn-glycerol-3-phosphate acyltransferase [Burkholderiales bacterium]